MDEKRKRDRRETGGQILGLLGVLTGIAAVLLAVNVLPETWDLLRDWGREEEDLGGRAVRDFLLVAGTCALGWLAVYLVRLGVDLSAPPEPPRD